jgi:hypothetical protein
VRATVLIPFAVRVSSALVASCTSFGSAPVAAPTTDRAELLGLLADEIAEQLPRPAADGDPRERVLAAWAEVYDYLARHQWAARIIAEDEYVLPSAELFARTMFAAMRELADEDVARVYRVTWSLPIGHVLNVHPTGHALGAAEGGAGRAPERPYHPRADFLRALPVLLDTLATPAPRYPGPPPCTSADSAPPDVPDGRERSTAAR